jgi:hypothetical protein
MGMELDVFDISNRSLDAVIEVQRSCPILSVCKKYGVSKPCHVICEMNIEATRRVFPGMKVDITRQAYGAFCVFKHEREAQA